MNNPITTTLSPIRTLKLRLSLRPLICLSLVLFLHSLHYVGHYHVLGFKFSNSVDLRL